MSSPRAYQRVELTDAYERVLSTGERVRVGDLAIVPAADLDRLEELEDRLDLIESLQTEREAREKGEEPIPWEKARAELDL